MPATEPEPLVVTYDEAARLLSCSPDMIRDLVARGDLPRVKVGTLVRIRKIDLEAFLASGGTSPNARWVPFDAEAVA